MKKQNNIIVQHAVIIIPGLGDGERNVKLVTKDWPRKYGLEPIIHLAQWKDHKDFEYKLKNLVDQIDELSNKRCKISLLGTSAGGSFIINAYCERRNKISKIINVCGRLRSGKNVFPSLDLASRTSPAFKQSVLLCEANLQSLTVQDKRKILTVRPLFDEIVPSPLIPIDGATNIRIFSVEHMLSIALAMTIYSKRMIEFILK